MDGRILAIRVFAVFLIFVILTTGSGAHNKITFVVDNSSQNIVNAIVGDYAKVDNAQKFLIIPKGNFNTSLDYYESRDVDLAMISGPVGEGSALHPEMTSLQRLDKSDKKYIHLFSDAVIAIVHANNSVQSLSSVELGKILTHQITSWDQIGWVGGGNITIKLDAYAHNTTMEFLQLFGISIETGLPTNFQLKYDYGNITSAILKDQFSLGFVSYSYLYKNPNIQLHDLKIDEIEANNSTIIGNTYAFIKQSYLVYPDGYVSRGRELFLNYLVSEESHTNLINLGYVYTAGDKSSLVDITAWQRIIHSSFLYIVLGLGLIVFLTGGWTDKMANIKHSPKPKRPRRGRGVRWLENDETPKE